MVVYVDGAARTLGQRQNRRYKNKYDICTDVSISNIGKSMDKSSYFGASIRGRTDSERNSGDLFRWSKEIVPRVNTFSYDDCYGGNISAYLENPDFDPIVIPGQTYNPQPSDKWVSFTASHESVVDLEQRKLAIRQYLFGVCIAFSFGIWKDFALSMNAVSDGQAVMREWRRQFLEDEIVTVTRRAEALRDKSRKIFEAEDPSVKMNYALQEWQAIQATGYAMMFPISWFASTLLSMIADNPCYAVWRQSAGNRRNLLSIVFAASGVRMIQIAYADNLSEWTKAGYKTKDNTSSRTDQRGGGKGDKKAGKAARGGKSSGGKSSATNSIICFNCGKMGHKKDDCMQKGGGRETQCNFCGNYGHREASCRQKQARNNGKGGKEGKGGGKGQDLVRRVNKDEMSLICKNPSCRGDRTTHRTEYCYDGDNKRDRQQSPVSRSLRTKVHDNQE
jgi:hypothetical protein